jgi:membrane protein
LSSTTETPAGEQTGSVPPGPQRFSAREWLAVLRRTGKQFSADDGSGLAQQVAYSSMLAFFPAAAAALGLLGILGLYDSVNHLLSSVAPSGVTKFVDGLHKDNPQGTDVLAFLLGLLGAIWAASGAMSTVIKAVNRAYDRLETRPFWRLRLTGIVLVLAAGVVFAGTLVLIVFGGPLGNAIAKRAHLGNAFNVLWDVLRWPLMFGAVLLFFALVYWLAPDLSQRDWKWISPGSILAGLSWLVLSGLFAVYATFSGSYSKTYGTLASGVILLLWLNYSAVALLLGAELNAQLDREADIHAAGGPRAGLIRPARRRR